MDGQPYYYKRLLQSAMGTAASISRSVDWSGYQTLTEWPFHAIIQDSSQKVGLQITWLRTIHIVREESHSPCWVDPFLSGPTWRRRLWKHCVVSRDSRENGTLQSPVVSPSDAHAAVFISRHGSCTHIKGLQWFSPMEKGKVSILVGIKVFRIREIEGWHRTTDFGAQKGSIDLRARLPESRWMVTTWQTRWLIKVSSSKTETNPSTVYNDQN